MVQTNQMISYLNSSVNVQKQDTGKTAKNDESKKSFSEALGEEISAQEKPAATEKTETEGVQQKDESAQLQPTETLQQTAAAVIPWNLQPQMLQQNVNTVQQNTVAGAEAGVQIIAETAAPLTEGKATDTNVNAQIQTSDSMLTAEAEGTDTVLFAGKLHSDAGKDALVQQAVKTEDSSVNALKADVEVSGLQQTSPQQTAETEMLSQNMQTQVAPQQTAETPQPVKAQTVDMSNMKQGVENLAKTISQEISQGRNEFEIWLEPANLGKMAVKVAYEGGKAMLSIICMSEKTLEIVSQNAKNLGAILQQNTGTDTVIVVEERPADYLQQQNQQQGGRDDAQNEQQQAKNNEQEAQQESFLQQLRLGLMQ